MEYRRLGKAGIQVSSISFGSWITFGNQIDRKVAEACMETAYDNGINFFDNAEVYAKGQSEIVMGEILQKMQWKRDTYLVSSKVFWGGDLPTQRGLHRKHIMEACEAGLRRLKVDYLDFFFCHRPDKNTPMEETVWAMHHLIEQGKVLYWGTSEWSAQEIMEAIMVSKVNHLIAPTMEQPQYNLLERRKMEVDYLKLFDDYGYGTTIWSPLASGFLTGKYNQGIPENARLNREEVNWIKDKLVTKQNIKKVKSLQTVANEIGTSLANLALAWTLKNSNVSTAITGASNVEQLKENLKALDVVGLLTPDIMERIEEIMTNKPIAPTY